MARRRVSTGGQDPGERAFLERYDASLYPHPSVAVDVVLLTVREGALWSLLVRREAYPQRGRWSLPGVDPPLPAGGTLLAFATGRFRKSCSVLRSPDFSIVSRLRD